MDRSLISSQNLPLGFGTPPLIFAWIAVVPLCGGLGAALGNWLDLLRVPVPAGLGGEWTKLCGALGSALGVGIVGGVLIHG